MKIGFIGAGNMGGALATAVSLSEAKGEILLYDTDAEKAERLAEEIGAKTVGSLADVSKADVLFLGVKPNILPGVLEKLAPTLDPKKPAILISMAAGVSLGAVEKLAGDGAKVIRIMPNTPVAVGRGMVVYAASDRVTKEDEALFLSLLSHAGCVLPIAEGKIDAESAVAGCGPAFAYLFIEALADGGVRAGLSRTDAYTYAAEMLIGAATMVKESGKHPGALKDDVCSPGGTTIEGVAALERGGFRSAVTEAVTAAYEKTLKMKK